MILTPAASVETNIARVSTRQIYPRKPTMCGNCEILDMRGHRRPAEELEAMSRVLRHRGPDEQGTFSSGSVALAFRRLSIVDILGGHQPMCNEERNVWIVFNGEIYNHADLRHDLEKRGHRFASHSDT